MIDLKEIEEFLVPDISLEVYMEKEEGKQYFVASFSSREYEAALAQKRGDTLEEAIEKTLAYLKWKIHWLDDWYPKEFIEKVRKKGE
jgi:hypothetical protein